MNIAAVTPAGEQPRDDVLVATALAEPAAFSAIYERYWLAVYRYLRAQGADEDSAMDLTASTFERAISSLRSYRGHGGGLGAWLMRIARNARIDEHRRSSRSTGLAAADHLAAVGPTHESDIELRLLLAQLPSDTRDAIALRYAAGLTAVEIGHVLDKRPEAVQKMIERGLSALREALDEH